MDLSKLSDADLQAMYSRSSAVSPQLNAIKSIESGGADDSSTIQGPVTKSGARAQGSMQVMPATARNPGMGIAPSDGTPEDTARVGREYYGKLQNKYGDDTVAAGAYNWGPGNVDKWLAAGGDPSQLPDETLKYMYNFNNKTGGSKAADVPSHDDLSKMSDDDLKKAYAATQGNKGSTGLLDTIGKEAGGLGLQAMNLGAGALEAIPVGAHALYTAATQGSLKAGVDQGMKDFGDYSAEKGLEKLGFNTDPAKNTGSYGAVNDAMDAIFNTAPNMIAQGANENYIRNALSQGGMAPDENTVKQTASMTAPDMATGLQLGMLAEPLAHIPGMFRGKPNDIGAASELDKLNGEPTLNPVTPEQGDFFNDPQFQGPARPDITPDVTEPSSFNPDRRQGRFDFNNDLNETSSGPMAVDREGVAGTPDQMESIKPFKDEMTQRVEALNAKEPEQLDLFHQDDSTPIEDSGRALGKDEFAQTVSDLANKDGTRFPMPEDIDMAYDRYLDTISDRQGGLFSPSEMAKNFADKAREEAVMRRVNDHPIVKANQAKVDALQAQLEGMREAGKSTRNIQAKAEEAQRTLEKSQKNIGKDLEPAMRQQLPWEKDGTVNMFTFGHLPEMFKSIAAVLKNLHGLVFKTADKVLPRMRNLDSRGKIIAQGVKDYVNAQAKKDYSQTVNEKPQQTLIGVPGLKAAVQEFNPFSAQRLSDNAIKAQMVEAPDISSGNRDSFTNHVAQGGLMLTNLTRNPIVKFVSESVDTAMRNTKQFVREDLVGKDGLRTKMQKMTSDELTGIRSLMEMNEGKREFSESELKSQGFSDKQVDYYKQSLKLENDAFQKLNDGRAKAGLPPVDKRIAHIAGYFMGDFRRLITDQEGKVVAVLAHNYKSALNTITKRFLEDHPDAANLKTEPIKMNRLTDAKGSFDNRFQGYMEVLNTLKDTNADVGRVVEAYKDYMSKDAASAMANRAKFKQKEGVLGAEGRKSWQSATKNAKEGAVQQLRYLESMDKWSEMQKAIEDSKKFIADPDIDKPNAKKLAQQYLDAVQGRNQGPVQHALNGILNGVAEATGIGPNVWKGANNVTKSLMLAKFVGMFKLSHSVVTMLQPIQSMPHLNSLLRARGADVGLTGSTALLKGIGSTYRLLAGKTDDPFLKDAKAYMDKNGTTDVGMSNHYDNVTPASQKWENLKHVSEFNVRVPEVGARTFTFMYYSHLLNDMGLPKSEIFDTAHNLMRYAMVDYSPHERPMMFGKMGLMGDIASTLTRFKYNQISQHMIGAAEVQRGTSIKPLMATLMSTMALGGIRGMFAYELANETLDKVSTILAKMGVISQPTSLDDLVLKSLHGMNSGMKDMLNWGGMAAFGVNMTGSLTNADTIPTDPLGALVPVGSEFANLGGEAANLAMHPNTQNVKRMTQALLPNSMKGMGENAMFTDEKGNYYNPKTGMLEARRSETDKLKRDFSFRPLEESKNNLVAQVAQSKEANITEVKHEILEQAKMDMLSNGGRLTPEQAQKYITRYSKELGGDPRSFEADLVTFLGKGRHLDRLQREQGIPTGNSMSEVTRYQRTQELK